MENKKLDELIDEAVEYSKEKTASPLQGAGKPAAWPAETVRNMLARAYMDGYLKALEDGKSEC